MKLIPMSPADFQAFATGSVAGYARDMARTYGLPEAVAIETARADLNELLPDGLHSEGHYFYRLCIGNDVAVGSLWMGVVQSPPLPTKLFIYDLEIDRPFRRQGRGRQAMSAVESWAIKRGIRRLELNVFSDNAAARTLYETSGMNVHEMTMGKDL